MNKKEIAQLLTVASGFDRRVVDPVTVEAWALVPEFAEADYADAVRAVVAHQTSDKRMEYLTIGHIVDALRVEGRTTQKAIEVDVRSAKARKLIDPSWPATDPLPDDIREALFTLRNGERRAAEERFALDQIEGSPVDVGAVGRPF